MRLLRLLGQVGLPWLLLAAGLFGATDAPAVVNVERRDGRVRVGTARYRAEIDPANGGRVVSLVWDGLELTRLNPDGHGGLIEEVHSSDFPFSVTEREHREGRFEIELEGRTENLLVTRRYVFPTERPWFRVELTFRNLTPYPLSGPDAPAVRCLALPAGGSATGREIYCLNRGRGAEHLTARSFASRLHADPGGARLRWMAVSEPASRRAVGFAPAHGGCSPLPPLRSADGAALLGWRYPTVPPGGQLKTEVMVVLLEGFGAVSELNPRFVAETLVTGAGPERRGDRGAGVRVRLMPLSAPLKDVSVLTRPYNAAGRESAPCDAVLFEKLEPLERGTGRTRCPGQATSAAWITHEVYSEGRRVGGFAVPLSGGAPHPGESETAGLPPIERTWKPPERGRAAQIPLTAERRRRGVLVWKFGGTPPREEVEEIELLLAADERRTVFLGVHALRPVADLRFALAGSGGRGAASVPLAAVDLWQVRQMEGQAALVPFSGTPLSAGDTTWLALTIDAERMPPGRHVSRLVIGTDSSVKEMPLSVLVLSLSPPAEDIFGLWLLDSVAGEGLPEAVPGKLRDYGITGLTLPARAPGALQSRAEAAGLSLLGFGAAGGTLPPEERAPERTPLPYPEPLWVVHREVASPAAAEAACRAGYVPALLHERVEGIDFTVPEDAPAPFLLVEEGCEAGRVPDLVKSGALTGAEPVWLALDLRGMDWRRAAVAVREAFWAAAWQGCAGAAVRAPLPCEEVDRQLAVWHILRDARREVALWRHVREMAARIRRERRGRGPVPSSAKAEDGQQFPDRTVYLMEKLDRTVGTAAHCRIQLRPERHPFRRLLRPAPDPAEPGLSKFAATRRTVLEIARRLAPLVPEEFPSQAYWQDIPHSRDGLCRWRIVAAAGEESWKAAAELQTAIRSRVGAGVPLERGLPSLDAEGAPDLVWMVADTDLPRSLPDELRDAAHRRPESPIVVAELKSGAVIVLLRRGWEPAAVLRPLRHTSELYRRARSIR